MTALAKSLSGSVAQQVQDIKINLIREEMTKTNISHYKYCWCGEFHRMGNLFCHDKSPLSSKVNFFFFRKI